MKWSSFGRAALAVLSALSLGLSMTACGGGTIAYLWAVGSTSAGSGQVVGYKVDHFTGNLTAVPEQPFSSHDSNPVQILVRTGGRFVYVINQGSGYGPGTPGTSEGIDEYAIGGEGTLTYENHYDTQGFGHIWGTFDTTGSFLFIVDKYSPNYQGDSTKPGYDPNGAVTVFTSDATTGRLQLQTQNNFTLPNQPAARFVEVGQTPRQLFSTGSCLYTLNDVGQTVTAYSYSNGQLATVTTGTFQVNSTSATSINGNAQFVFITDSISANGASTGARVFSYTVSNCALVPFTQSPVTTQAGGVTNPQYTFYTTGNYLYVLNANNPNSQVNAQGSTVSGYVVNAGQLQELSGSPFPAGSGPVCMVEDPTNEYLYTSDAGQGTITGFAYSNTTGQLAPLPRGSSFQTSTQSLGCLAISGIV